jgi:hypothetical protein
MTLRAAPDDHISHLPSQERNDRNRIPGLLQSVLIQGKDGPKFRLFAAQITFSDNSGIVKQRM